MSVYGVTILHCTRLHDSLHSFVGFTSKFWFRNCCLHALSGPPWLASLPSVGMHKEFVGASLPKRVAFRRVSIVEFYVQQPYARGRITLGP